MKTIKEIRAELEKTIKENKKLKREIKQKDKEIQTLLARIELWKDKNKNKRAYKPKKQDKYMSTVQNGYGKQI